MQDFSHTLAKTFNAHQARLTGVLPGWRMKTPDALFNHLAAAEPSEKKINLKWLLVQTGKGHVTPGNLGAVSRALRLAAADPRDLDISTLTADDLLTRTTTPIKQRLARMLDNPRQRALWQRLPGCPADKEQQTDFALDQLIAADPTGGRHVPDMVRWLARPHAPLLPEDLPKVTNHLTLFIRHRQEIMPTARPSLAGCASAADLATLVRRFDRTDQGGSNPRAQVEDFCIADGQARLVQETDTFRLIHMTSERGAQRLGKDTDWCTSWGDGDGRTSYFEDYSDDLLYVRSKADESIYQLHFGTGQLRNAQDYDIPDLPGWLHRHPGLSTALTPYVRRHLPAALTSEASQGYIIGIGALFVASGKIPEWAGTVATALPAILTAATEAYQPANVVELLTFCRNVPAWKKAASTVADRVIPATLTATGHVGEMIDLLTLCREVPEWKRAASTVAGNIIPATLTAAAMEGNQYKMINLLTVYRDVPAWKRAASTVTDDIIPAALTEAAADKKTEDIGNLLAICREVPAWKKAANTVADKVIPTALIAAAADQRTEDMIKLLTVCRDVPTWKTIATVAIPAALSAYPNRYDMPQKAKDLIVDYYRKPDPVPARGHSPSPGNIRPV